MQLTSTLLKHFRAVYDEGSLGKAGVRLGVSQPALSKSLRRLEDLLGVELFERTTGGMLPTKFGHALAQPARSIETELDQIRTDISRLNNSVSGQLSFGVSQAVSDTSLTNVTLRLREARPDLRLNIVEGLTEDLISKVLEGAIEFALCTRVSADSPDIEVLPLYLDRFVVVAGVGHDLAVKTGILPGDLHQYPWVMHHRSSRVRQSLGFLFASAGLNTPWPHVETTSQGHIKNLVIASNYLAFLPEHHVQAEIRSGLIKVLDLAGFSWSRQVSAVCKANRPLSPAGQIVIEELRLRPPL